MLVFFHVVFSPGGCVFYLMGLEDSDAKEVRLEGPVVTDCGPTDWGPTDTPAPLSPVSEWIESRPPCSSPWPSCPAYVFLGRKNGFTLEFCGI